MGGVGLKRFLQIPCERAFSLQGASLKCLILPSSKYTYFLTYLNLPSSKIHLPSKTFHFREALHKKKDAKEYDIVPSWKKYTFDNKIVIFVCIFERIFC